MKIFDPTFLLQNFITIFCTSNVFYQNIFSQIFLPPNFFWPNFFFAQKVSIEWQNCYNKFNYRMTIVYLSHWYQQLLLLDFEDLHSWCGFLDLNFILESWLIITPCISFPVCKMGMSNLTSITISFMKYIK